MSQQTMGEFLATLRKANGYTQQEVAEKLNISNRTLSSWETDRTTPDVLLLPAVADLYGVTVDELVRGERITEKTERTELSEKSQLAARKNRLGKFSAKSALLTGLALLCASLFVIAGLIATLTNSPMVLDIILLILTAAGFAICVVLLFYFLYATKSAEGIVLSDDLTDDKKAFLLALKHKAAKFLAINSTPFIAGALIFLSIYITHSTEVSIDYSYPIVSTSAPLSVVCVLAAAALLISAAIYGNINFSKLANASQLTTHKHNAKLIGKLCEFGAIPVILGLIAVILVHVYAPDYSFSYFGSWVWLIIIILTILICLIIYLVKREKQRYGF